MGNKDSLNRRWSSVQAFKQLRDCILLLEEVKFVCVNQSLYRVCCMVQRGHMEYGRLPTEGDDALKPHIIYYMPSSGPSFTGY